MWPYNKGAEGSLKDRMDNNSQRQMKLGQLRSANDRQKRLGESQRN